MKPIRFALITFVSLNTNASLGLKKSIMFLKVIILNFLSTITSFDSSLGFWGFKAISFFWNFVI